MDIDLQDDYVQPLGEHNSKYHCVKTNSFPLVDYPFEYFNPMQSDYLSALDNNEWNANIVVESPTASGKTVCCEIAMALANANGKKGVTLVPLKALAEEKYNEWCGIDHSFFDLETEILTGDYSQFIKSKDLEEANIIIMTSEALDHRTRHIKKNAWIKDIGMLVVDEVHLIGMDGERADRLETAIMRFVKNCPDANIALLSATMTNSSDLKQWLEKITGRNCIYVKSDYRPCKLNVYYETHREFDYKDGGWKATEESIKETVFKIVRNHRSKQWIIFTGGKRFGRDLRDYFKMMRFKEVDFISADDTHKDRLSKVKKFKSGEIKYLISTTLLAYGLNLPARMVCVANVTRGKQDIETCDILQMVGRAGRPKYDTEGDAYILLPESETTYHKDRIKKGQIINSRLKKPETLIFHMVAEIYNREIRDVKSFNKWFDNSLASAQGTKYNNVEIERLFKRLEKILMIDRENGCRVTNLGKVCAWLYFSPEDVFDWWRNFQELFVMMGGKFGDEHVAWAISNIHTWKQDFMTRDLKTATKSYDKELGKEFYGGEEKWGACIWNMLRGKDNGILSNMEAAIRYDLERTIQALKLIDIHYSHWGHVKFFDGLKMRILYGVGEELVGLVNIKNVGNARANKLWLKGIKTKEDFVNQENAYIVKSVMGKRLTESLSYAKNLLEMENNKSEENGFD